MNSKDTLEDLSGPGLSSKEEDDEEINESQSSGSGLEQETSSRDEELEIRKEMQKETTRVMVWRICVTLALLATGVAVTAATYALLVEQEDKNFRNVYSQFARTVADAASEQQANLLNAAKLYADMIAIAAIQAGGGESPWPFYIPPNFEITSTEFIKASRIEWNAMNVMVKHEHRDAYVEFMNEHYEDMIKESHMQRFGNLDELDQDTSKYHPYIMQKVNGTFIPDDEKEFYLARQSQSPPHLNYGLLNNNFLASSKVLYDVNIAAMMPGMAGAISTIKDFANIPIDLHARMHSNGAEGAKNPHSFVFYPFRERPEDPSSDVVGVISIAIAWDVSMLNLLPDNVEGMYCVLQNTCNQTVTYRIDGKDAVYLGEGDLHTRYDDMAVHVDLNVLENPDAASIPGHCMYSMDIYPSKAFEDDYKTDTPLIFAIVVACTFLFVMVVYFIYDITVHKRNETMIANAAKSNAVLTSFIPDHLRKRLLDEKAQEVESKKAGKHGNLKSFLNSNQQGNSDKPLADLFLDTTVLYADLAGFTAWSSVREPTQVFTLLETLFQAYDSIAKRRRVFKVETVGDCYVAVSGLPDPRPDHAVVMARFARDVIARSRVLLKELEVMLGPDTSDLELRLGMHSGPVTGGLLRGERSRFQLFGDTMNTCARLEATGKRGRIHCSKVTADLIVKAGKGDWLEKRDEPVVLIGKGTIDSYWLSVPGERANSVTSAVSGNDQLVAHKSYGPRMSHLGDRINRLIDWNVETLLNLIKQIVARRAVTTSKARKNLPSRTKSSDGSLQIASTPLEEVKEIISLPEFDQSVAKKEMDPEKVYVPDEIVTQLHNFVSNIACMYNDNPFHNFDHASHVVMSVIKLMSRIVSTAYVEGIDEKDVAAASLHDHTYGITSDPLTQFACAFSALIHDVDHVGVSNAQLVKEEIAIAKKYGRSVAEQNSLDLSWDLLMRPDYASLRAFLFPTHAELVRFRQLVVNSVMSTDIVDKDLKELRNGRWDKAFKTGSGSSYMEEDPRDEINRKATIVIEHIIQASDIAHTMQHWHVYRKWNQNLFEELYVAYLNGRMEKSPVEFWYKGEFGFFDFYILPLTEKLKSCGVFGVSSGEFLDFAQKNRAEWESQGEEVIAEMIVECEAKYGVKGDVLPLALEKKKYPRGCAVEQAMEQAVAAPRRPADYEIDC